MKINYSIIIPHKNIPELLQRCLDSIPIRKDVQVIVVDDNSDPNVVDFEEFPGLNTPNVEVYFTKEGKGAGYARNIGLKYVKGKWVLFADADDTFVENFLSALDKYVKSSNDIIYFLTKGIDNITGKPSYRDYVYDLQLTYAKKRNDIYMYYFYIFQPWGKMYSHKFVSDNKIVFEETMVGNDRMFSVKSLCLANQISLDESKIYISYTRQESLVFRPGESMNIERLMVNIRVNKYILQSKYHKYHLNLYYLLYIHCVKFGFRHRLKVLYLLYKNFSLQYFVRDIYSFIVDNIDCYFFKKKALLNL